MDNGKCDSQSTVEEKLKNDDDRRGKMKNM